LKFPENTRILGHGLIKSSGARKSSKPCGKALMKKKVLEIVLFISQAISTFLILQRALAQQTLNGSMEKEEKKTRKTFTFLL
jgi:hypothetical protein